MSELYIISTPIGNLKDITLRALEVLKEVDFILCEDTRHTKKLLDHYSINKPLISYHQHSKIKKVKDIIDYLRKGKDMALVSDAGTPGISDPGNKLIEYILEQDIKVNITPIPGPSAITAAASVCGFATDKFYFLGFIPHKKGKQTLLKKIAQYEEVVIFYESTHRIIKTLERLKEYLDKDRRMAVMRELTKKFESIYRGNIEEVIDKLSKDKIKGEFVVIIDRKK